LHKRVKGVKGVNGVNEVNEVNGVNNSPSILEGVAVGQGSNMKRVKEVKVLKEE